MKALLFVLNDADLLPSVLKKFNEIGIRGCTIFDSNGMARELVKGDEFSDMFGSLRQLLKPNLKNTKTLLLVLDDAKINSVIEAIESVVGDLTLPETGILFTFPLDLVKGTKI